MTYLEALILAIIEGITEFLPISSTGHMIIASTIMGINENTLVKNFEVVIQFGAILSVVALYWQKFFTSFRFYLKLAFAFLPAAVIGVLLGDYIDSLLMNIWVVITTLFLGGIVLIFVDKWFRHANEAKEQEISWSQGFKIGCFQCIAMIPGVSRSAATIIGGMSTGLNRRTAAEFSFFLAVPTMLGASAKKLIDSYATIQHHDIKILLFGNIVAFIVAMLAIKAFVGFLKQHGFKWFGYYRIIVGVVLAIVAVLLKIQM
ncbi:MAG: undecaprenyl-diphosphate phosphatase [Candidatus Jettenia sp.]|uniref:Undecaprenyl-diphosphatase n=1 Tax=Candidatus Jettenia caeni TaxID=247490 RepID=I3IH78_9BACT|nr:undecaprenyl-diphosphate phosphatase [Candidatus Jettenia sp. AMX1]MBC6929190.1 undecaprenyl-diphosphate phosphatase [Candidatus Jettenia sp.]NUN23772.1 undecaprenyl-diphosphate phosphatase [Candidatus Jettenia caeni]KAA0250147.1 MAG: undecaprenyl-diphosphate phosphatase [Candidatus Jettenia sp. AMX1]MCE7880577.1 undecaprenyl-diphosphate phosphatase [Candidatus Jettenia sp. AMX1]MCQ3927378.1 undecaprenyl-diphosphate phosphatase [Candidatus Jettenia sp.]